MPIVRTWVPSGRITCTLPDSVVVAICHHDVALAIDRHTTGTVKLPCSVAVAADCAHVGAIGTENLDSVVVGICHHDVALAVNRHATGTVELPCSVAFAADCAHVGAI